MEASRRMFAVADYVVFSLVLVVSAAIGIFYGCTGSKQSTTAEFLLADRKMQILPVAMSLLASFMSAIMLLGTPAEIYLFGTQYTIIAIGYCMLAPVIAYLYIPVFYRLKLTSVYEYLELRFRKKFMRTAGCLLFIIQMTMYLAIVLYAPSLALNAVTGLNVWVSVFSVGCVCVFYTTLGGMKAVMWTDVFQICMMLAGLLAVLIQSSINMGGYHNVIEAAKRGNRLQFFDFNPDMGARHTVWSLTFGALFTWMAISGVNQTQVQRALSCPTLRNAQIAVLLNCPGLIVLLVLTSLCGLAMYAHFKDCDPLLNGEIDASDQLLPLFVMQSIGHIPGLPGLFVACLFSGTLSTISSGLNSLAAVTIEDIVRGNLYPDVKESTATKLSKAFGVCYGVIMIALTFIAAQLGAVLQAALALFGILGGPLLGAFTLGLFFPRANWKGAVVGVIVALPLSLWIGLGSILNRPPLPAPERSVSGCPLANITDNIDNITAYNPDLTTWRENTADLLTYDSPSTSTPASNKKFWSSPDYKDGWDRFYSLSYLWYSMVAVLVVCGVGVPVSWLSATEADEEADPETICPIFDILCACLSSKHQKKLCCLPPDDQVMPVSDLTPRTQGNHEKSNPDEIYNKKPATTSV